MTDLEITRLCAMAMGYGEFAWQKGGIMTGSDLPIGMPSGRISYDPLHDDAQAMALVKAYGLNVYRYARSKIGSDEYWWQATADGLLGADDADLNRAICECVAKMQAAK